MVMVEANYEEAHDSWGVKVKIISWYTNNLDFEA